jgi:hypothetical protein
MWHAAARSAGNRERVRGIEPPFSAWEADVLPLNYTREAGEGTKWGADASSCDTDAMSTPGEASYSERFLAESARILGSTDVGVVERVADPDAARTEVGELVTKMLEAFRSGDTA